MSVSSFDECYYYDGIEEVIAHLEKLVKVKKPEKIGQTADLRERMQVLSVFVQNSSKEGESSLKEVRQLFDLARELGVDPLAYLARGEMHALDDSCSSTDNSSSDDDLPNYSSSDFSEISDLSDNDYMSDVSDDSYLDDKEEDSFLGKGSFGTVSMITKPDGTKRAYKVTNGGLGPLEGRVAQCSSKFIARGEACKEGVSLEMELASHRVSLNPKMAPFLIECVAKAIEEVSLEMGRLVVHRDIKLDNIGITEEGDWKLLDWGAASFENEVTKPKRGQTIPGTVISLTPEILSGEEIDPSKIDSFGMGVALYTLLTRGNYHPLLPIPEEEAKKRPPFKLMAQLSSLGDRASKAALQFKANIKAVKMLPGVSKQIYKIMKGLLKIDPKERITPGEALAYTPLVSKVAKV